MEDLIFWGATGQAKVLNECLNGGPFNLIALFDNDRSKKSPFSNVPIYYGFEGFTTWQQQQKHQREISFVVAIGGHNGEARVEIQSHLISRGLKAISAIHQTSYISQGVIFGIGSQILAKSFLGVDSTLGIGCIINSGAIVDHDCQIGNGVHIGPGARLAGSVCVEDFVTIYTGAIIGPKVKIGAGSIIGAGSVVLKDVEPRTVVVGNPGYTLRCLVAN